MVTISVSDTRNRKDHKRQVGVWPASFFFLPVFSLLLTGCAANLFLSREEVANGIARTVHWVPVDIATTPVGLRLYAPANPAPSEQVIIYLEGDGLSWISVWQPSSDPTPKDPVGLRLAAVHPDGPAAYLARPCQYRKSELSRQCGTKYWTYARYSEDVVAAMSQGVDYVKSLFKAQNVILVGYSGGGVVAALLAARRDDVTLIVTVAANLDIDYWARFHDVSPLVESLNPADFGARLKRQRQIHFVGTDDEIVPPEVVRSYALKVDKSLLQTIRLVKDADHTCCWVDAWPRLFPASVRQR